MPHFEIGPQDGLYYEHVRPKSANGKTFVFFNALTGDTGMWEGALGPRVREAGHGTLVYNMRGQTNSPFSPNLTLTADLIVQDAAQLLFETKPVKPVFIGLSIGGLFAARTCLEGAFATGLVLINTLRQDGPRLKWINDAIVRVVEVGGPDLLRDLYFQLLLNEDWLANNRPDFLKADPTYAPLKPDSGAYKMLAEAGRTADWNLPYEKLNLPTLVISGLQDHIFFEKEIVDDLFNRLPRGHRVDMSDAGHMIPMERPEALAQMLLNFVKEF